MLKTKLNIVKDAHLLGDDFKTSTSVLFLKTCFTNHNNESSKWLGTESLSVTSSMDVRYTFKGDIWRDHRITVPIVDPKAYLILALSLRLQLPLGNDLCH